MLNLILAQCIIFGGLTTIPILTIVHLISCIWIMFLYQIIILFPLSMFISFKRLLAGGFHHFGKDDSTVSYVCSNCLLSSLIVPNILHLGSFECVTCFLTGCSGLSAISRICLNTLVCFINFEDFLFFLLYVINVKHVFIINIHYNKQSNKFCRSGSGISYDTEIVMCGQ